MRRDLFDPLWVRRVRAFRKPWGRARALAFFAALGMVFAVRVAAEESLVRRITLDRYDVTINFPVGDERVARKVADICDEALPVLANQIGLDVVRSFQVFLIPDLKAYQERVGIRLPSWGIAFAFMENQIMLVDVPRATSAWNSLDKVIPHELSHLLLAQRVGSVPLPLWFMEGLAQWQAKEWTVLESWRLMEAVWGNRAPTLLQISSALPADETGARTAYRVAYTGFIERFAGRTEALPAFLGEVAKRKDFGDAFTTFWGESEYEFADRFARDLDHKYRSRLMIFQTGPLFTVLAFLFLFVMLRIWLRNRKRLQEMERRERGLSPWDQPRFPDGV